MKLNDLSGRRFDRLVVLGRAPNLYQRHTAWTCRCDCGGETVIVTDSLIRGRTTSCGCYRRNDHTEVTYERVHQRLNELRGAARDQPCRTCGQPALHWSYDYQDAAQLFDRTRPSEPPYSLDADHYVPLCASCHKLQDIAHKAADLAKTPGRNSPTH